MRDAQNIPNKEEEKEDRIQDPEREGEELVLGVLWEVYTHRILNRKLLMQEYFLKEGAGETEADERLQRLCAFSELEEISFPEDGPVYGITQKGVEHLRLAGKKVSVSAKSLWLDRELFRHQLSLNAFVYSLKQVLGEDEPHTYWDLKHLPVKNSNLKPDGLVALEDAFLFLEMDLGTERSRDLAFKWEGYRDFLKEHDPFYEKPVFLLLILSGSSYCSARRHTAAKTAVPRLGAYLGRNLELFSENPENLLRFLKNRLDFCRRDAAQKEEELFLKQPAFLKFRRKKREEFFLKTGELTGDYRITAKIPETFDSSGKGTITFMLDFWLDNRFSVYEKINAQSEEQEDNPLSYVVVVKDRNQVKRELNQVDIRIGSLVYFIQLKDLTSPFWDQKFFRVSGPVGNRWIREVPDFFQRVSAPI